MKSKLPAPWHMQWILTAAVLVACGYQGLVAGPTVPLPRELSEVARPLPEMEHGPRGGKQIALTFDAGGKPDGLPDLLKALNREGVRATFFLSGRWACEFPAFARAIAAGGHVIGNHSWGHKDLTKLLDWEVRQEVLRADDRLASWFDTRYFPIFRAPFGEMNARVFSIVEKLGFRSIRWSVDTLDAMEPRKSASFIERRVTDRTDDELRGAIVLMHVGYEETSAALPGMIRDLRRRGFEFVTIPHWVEAPAIASSATAAR